MNDERLERQLRELFRDDAPNSAPNSLRLHAAELSRRVRPIPPRRRLSVVLVRALAAAAVAAAFVFALVLTVPLDGPREVPASRVPASPGLTSMSPASTPPATASVPATEASGWSFRVADSPGTPMPVRGSDGTIYLATKPFGARGQGAVYALDPLGQVRSGWPFAPEGVVAFGTPAIGADGTLYVFSTTFGSTGSRLWALDPSGHVKPGWPYEALSIMPFGQALATPDGGAVFVEAQDSGTHQVVTLTPQGSLKAGWPVSLPGSWTCGEGGACAALGNDGTWYGLVQVGASSDAEIVGIRPDGSSAPGWPVRIAGGEGFVLTPGGAICAWGYDTNGIAPPMGITTILRTRFLLLGADGQPKPGWPVTIAGPSGIPTIGADDTMYATAGAAAGTQTILALGPDGRERAGWPYTLPTEIAAWPYAPSAGAPDRPTSPSVGADGRVILPVFRAPDTNGQKGLLALRPTGEVSPGWPIWLPTDTSFETIGGYVQGGGGALVSPVGGQEGTVYLAVASGARAEILALDAGGALKPGWPRPVADTPSRAVGLFLVPDAGLVVTVQTDLGNATLVTLVMTR